VGDYTGKESCTTRWREEARERGEEMKEKERINSKFDSSDPIARSNTRDRGLKL
jgi:hypothetical protein